MLGLDVSARPRGVKMPPWVAPLLLGVACLLIYNANLRTIGATDTLSARYQPLILWHNGTLGFDGNARLVAHGHPLTASAAGARAGTDSNATPFESESTWIVRTHSGHLASLYPVVAPLLVAPLYAPAVLWLDHAGWSQPNIDRAAEIMEKVSASVLAAIASLLMFLVLRREGNRWALPLTVAFAFGTDTWMISSQALWQHGAGELLVVLGLLLTVSRSSPLRTALLGFDCALIAANRPPDVLIAAAFLLYACWNRRREAVWLLAGLVVPAAALLTYNLDFLGNLVGGYALADKLNHSFFQVDVLGLPGLLISPTRGLLVFCPFFLFVGFGMARRLRTPSSRALAITVSSAVVAQLVVYSQTSDWRAGWSWGPRWLTDLLPLLVWLLAPAPLALKSRGRRFLIATIVAAVGIQTIGAFWYTHTSDAHIFAAASMSGAWDPRNTPFIAELHHGPAAFELTCGISGQIDSPAPVPASARSVPELQPTGIQGWTLACGRTPAQVLLLIDGRIVGQTQRFFDRPDVDRALGSEAPSGWSMSATTTGIAPGRHVLQLAVRISRTSDIRILREEPVLVTPPPSLKELAALAAKRLRADQSAAGYWLTDYTSTPHYIAPGHEMNTYLTSILADLLVPVAPKLGLANVVARAKHELAAQVESTGLVRYHGLPTGPTIGTLGCVITPDADDTSLVWRIAGLSATDPRLPHMLATLTRYRDARGLYRTWLAPQSAYQCLNIGHDPDPADIAIQMHVYLMLRTFDPPAAQALCKAIVRTADTNAVWVYYAKSALVPYLRSAELEQLGCPVPLPTTRLSRQQLGQGWWSDLARLLVRSGGAQASPQTRQAMRVVLTSLGDDDFALLREAPPLLYNNDPTASVKRLYWSQDAGYALWLRLYLAAGFAAP